MDNTQTNSRIFTNKGGNTLIREFEGVLSNNPTIKNLDAVVGFLRASGYFSLRPFLDNINKVRVLIGIDVDKYIAKAAKLGEMFHHAEDAVKKDALHSIREDIERSGYRKEIEDGIFQMVTDLKDGKLELRAHPSKRIHAKIYILYPDDFNQYTQAMAITGSSNLSGNGLGISQDYQYEFNVKMSDYEEVQFAKDEFEALWEEAKNCEITAADIQAEVNNTYLKEDFSPYDLYIKMLMEYFSDRVLESDTSNALDVPEGYNRYEYQMDAVLDGYQKLLRYDGFFLADVVGLGKTIVAAMIAKKFIIENGRANTKVLVVYPQAVENNWKTTFHDFSIYDNAKFITNGRLERILDENNYDYWSAAEYDLILVDEAHKFRTHTNSSFKQLQEICKMPRVNQGHIPGYRKKVMLISATPINNSFKDIYYQTLLFQDSRRCTIDGLTNLSAFFDDIDKRFKEIRKKETFDAEAYEALAREVREKAIKPITVRRTRTDIENIERYRKDIGGFPKVEKPIENSYELNEHLADLFEKAMHTLVKDLTYARYQAIAYLKPEVSRGRYDQAELISHSLANIRKNGLVKRLESSFHAFIISINNFKQANQNMIDMFNKDDGKGKVYIAPDLDINKMLADDWKEEEIEEKLNEKAKTNPKNDIFEAADFIDGFYEMLLADQKLLDQMCADWDNVNDKDDSKFDKFQALLDSELFDKKRNPGQKLVVFSESVDTVNYLAKRIYRTDVLVVSSKNRDKLYKTICENFDANYKDKQDNYNIILTSDVLAEGVNLHRANVIVNYDTPWNSTKLMQRIGRVNRIGSDPNTSIFNYVFYPSRQGNQQIKLNEIALSKIQTFHSTYGEDNQIYSKEEKINHDIGALFDEAAQAQTEEQNLELPFYEELRDLYKINRREYDRIARMPLRCRTGREAKEAEGGALSDESLVFLKTNFRKLFFRVSDKVQEINSLEALESFKAEKSEPSAERIPQHHQHVEMALEKFSNIQKDEARQPKEKKTAFSSGGGRQTITALSLLTKIKPFIDNSDDILKIERLRVVVERGTLTPLAHLLEQIDKELKGNKGKVQKTTFELLPEIIDMANKYEKYCIAEEALKNTEETDAEIILSESFKPLQP